MKTKRLSNFSMLIRDVDGEELELEVENGEVISILVNGENPVEDEETLETVSNYISADFYDLISDILNPRDSFEDAS